MRFEKPVPLQQIAQLIDAELVGNTTASATGINEIHKVEQGDLAFVDHPKYYDTCLVRLQVLLSLIKNSDFPRGKALLIVEEPFEAYLKIVDHFRPLGSQGVTHELSYKEYRRIISVNQDGVFFGLNMRFKKC